MDNDIQDESEHDEFEDDAISLHQQKRRELALLRSDHISEKTRTLYRSSQLRFFRFIISTYPHLLLISADEFPQSEEPLKAYLNSILQIPINKARLPFLLESITEEHIMSWIVTLKKADGKIPSHSALNTHRSAIVALFTEFEVSNRLTKFNLLNTTHQEISIDFLFGNHFSGRDGSEGQKRANHLLQIAKKEGFEC
jgi:hypothetical protein